jgi:hypothetical protein
MTKEQPCLTIAAEHKEQDDVRTEKPPQRSLLPNEFHFTIHVLSDTDNTHRRASRSTGRYISEFFYSKAKLRRAQ